jgi:hypothetical protein
MQLPVMSIMALYLLNLLWLMLMLAIPKTNRTPNFNVECRLLEITKRSQKPKQTKTKN